MNELVREDRFDDRHVWLLFGLVKKITKRIAAEKPDSRYNINLLVAMGVLALNKCVVSFDTQPLV